MEPPRLEMFLPGKASSDVHGSIALSCSNDPFKNTHPSPIRINTPYLHFPTTPPMCSHSHLHPTASTRPGTGHGTPPFHVPTPHSKTPTPPPSASTRHTYTFVQPPKCAHIHICIPPHPPNPTQATVPRPFMSQCCFFFRGLKPWVSPLQQPPPPPLPHPSVRISVRFPVPKQPPPAGNVHEKQRVGTFWGVSLEHCSRGEGGVGTFCAKTEVSVQKEGLCGMHHRSRGRGSSGGAAIRPVPPFLWGDNPLDPVAGVPSHHSHRVMDLQRPMPSGIGPPDTRPCRN